MIGNQSSNLFNYDETNMSDDPGKIKVIHRRAVKYPEKIMNHSKSTINVIVCVSADRTLLPAYIIYKSLHLYDTWKENGPVGYRCCVNWTLSGWIDAPTFQV